MTYAERISRYLLIVILCCCAFAARADARSYRVAIKDLPSSEFYRRLLDAIAEETDSTFLITVVPPARAEYLVAHGLVDIQIPQIFPDTPELRRKTNFEYSSIILYQTAFVLYTKKDARISRKDITSNTGEIIETEPSLLDSFTFTASRSASTPSSLKKVSFGRIDGFMGSQYSSDFFLRDMNLHNIKRQLYGTYRITLTFPKATGWKDTEKLLHDGIQTLKLSGKYDRIMGELIRNAKYSDWQP